MRKSSYRDLLVWQKSFILSTDLYRLTATFPKSEQFGLVSQIQRAGTSIPCNISEGHGRSSDADFARFLYMAFGSMQEVETLLLISAELGFLQNVDEWTDRTQEIAKMLRGLINSLH